MYVSYVGEIFLRMLKALILPLIVPSLITAVGSLDMSLSGVRKFSKLLKYFWFYWGRVGGRAITYYLSTTGLAVVLGIILVVTVHPGVSGQEKVEFFHSKSFLFFSTLIIEWSVHRWVRISEWKLVQFDSNLWCNLKFIFCLIYETKIIFPEASTVW